MRRRKPGEGQQRLGYPVLLRMPGRGCGLGGAVEPVFDAGAGKHRDDAVRQHVEKIVQARRAVAQRAGQHIGVEPRQHARRAGQPDHRGRQFGRVAIRRRRNRDDLRRRIGHARRRAKPRRLRRVGRSSRLGEDAHRRVEAEAPRLRQQLRMRRAAGARHYSSTRMPARAGHAAARPDRPRTAALVRTNEFTVACSARKRSSTAASR